MRQTAVITYCIPIFTATWLTVMACTGQTSDTEPSRSLQDTSGGTLELTRVDPNHVAGTYVRQGVGIRFESRVDDSTVRLQVRTMDGQEIYLIEKDSAVGVTNLLGGQFRVTADEAAFSNAQKGTADPERLKVEGDLKAVERRLAEMPETAVLPWLSRALGETGITGAQYVGSLPLHRLAQKHAAAMKISVTPLARAAGSSKRPGVSSEQDALSVRECQDLQDDPNGDGCWGMCGPQCECWWWVCGDCCWHWSCYKHDSYYDQCNNGDWAACILYYDPRWVPFGC